MLTVDKFEIVGIEHAIRGMRNPFNSWDKSDSTLTISSERPAYKYKVGKNDLELMRKLAQAGTDHRKYLRMIVVYVDITAPLFWWKEFDTYKVGTVANSCSTMHTIAKKEFEPIDFSWEKIDRDVFGGVCNTIIAGLNVARQDYLDAKSKKDVNWMNHYWWQMIQLLPSAYNQKRTVMLNYEVLANIYKSRRHHPMGEGYWDVICNWIETLPYSELITGKR